MRHNNNKINKVNILDLRDSPWVDGPGRTILDCAESIEGERYHFIIGSFSGGAQKTGEYAEAAKERGLESIIISEKSSFDWRVILFILRLIKEHNIDLIHTHDFRSNIFGLMCAKIRGIPVLCTVHGWIANTMKGRLYGIVDRIFLRYFEHIISVSYTTKNIITRARVPDNKISIVENALVLGRYKIDRGKSSFRDEMNISSDTKLIANIGRLSHEKGQIEFLKAAKETLSNTKDVRFILFGKGPDETQLRKYVELNLLEDYVIFAGFRKDMIDIYNSLDLVVQSSYTEGMPNVILEALLMEVPVIATDVGGTSEIVEDNRNGILIKPGSIKELVEELNKFLQNENLYYEMSKKGRQTIIKRFSHEKRTRKLKAIYGEILVNRKQ